MILTKWSKQNMTKYILNSGGINNAPDKGQRFFRTIVEDLGHRPKVLFCFFAMPREEWEAKYAQYTDGFATHMTEDIHPHFTMAMPNDFEEQVRECDALYIHGGDDYLLRYWLSQYDLPKIWEGKIVATNSASSHALAKYFWTCDWRQCMDGFGVLPMKFLAHYESKFGADDPRGPIDWQAAKAELEAYHDKNLPVYALREGEFEIFES